jgi:hypothetical protein
MPTMRTQRNQIHLIFLGNANNFIARIALLQKLLLRIEI